MKILSARCTMSLLISISALANTPSYAQKWLFVDEETGLITFERTYDLDTLKAEFIFERTKEWFVEYFREADEVIRGELVPKMIKGTFVTDYAASMGVRQKYRNDIEVRIKDGAIRIRIFNLETEPGYDAEKYFLKMDGSFRKAEMYQKTYKDIEDKSEELCKNLLGHIIKSKVDDW